MTRIRPVSVDDATQIAAIYEPMVRQTAVSFELEPPAPDEIARRIESVSADHPWIVMEDEGALVGYAYATDFRQRPAYRWSTETTIYLDGDRQGRGLGKILYNALLEVAILWGYANAFAGIALPNPASEALHAAVGFQPIGVFPRAGFKMGRWHDVGWWHRSLSLAESPPDPTRPSPESLERLLSSLT
jgi:phosphinothricin acetyltransferase